MRLLVVSDSHKYTNNLLRAIEEQPSARYVIFLGDGERDIETAKQLYPQKQFIMVRGNCDFGSLLNDREFVIIGGKRIYCTHGHVEGVKHGTGNLISCARQEKADIVLYGHTHQAVTDYVDGMYVMNPGSVGYDKRYGFVDITEKGDVICILREME